MIKHNNLSTRAMQMNHSPTEHVSVVAFDRHVDKQRLIRVKEVLHTIGLGRTTLYALIKTGEFPEPRRVGKLSLWVESEVQAWIVRLTDSASKNAP
ncbi:AlpA family transcriptional regulator [Paraburkholderia sp. BL8N3]|nr:AlpA family phage regulatory protein [Paraburkholderia sp. BL8N3]TCK43443.1 AlpA family transcriptional regulator [Paraburkholderia sp. BL8N3]